MSNPIYNKFSYEEIAKRTKVTLPTAYNWEKKRNMPEKAIIKMGFMIVEGDTSEAKK